MYKDEAGALTSLPNPTLALAKSQPGSQGADLGGASRHLLAPWSLCWNLLWPTCGLSTLNAAS